MAIVNEFTSQDSVPVDLLIKMVELLSSFPQWHQPQVVQKTQSMLMTSLHLLAPS
jgi:hypothetical protein